MTRFYLLLYADGRQDVKAAACQRRDRADREMPAQPVTTVRLEPHPDLSCLCWRCLRG